MRLLASALIAVTFLAGCAFGGGVPSVTTVQAEPEPPAAPGPLEPNAVSSFNANVTKVLPRNASAERTARAFLGETPAYTFQAQEEASTAVVTVTSPNLADDSVRNERYEVRLARAANGWWVIASYRRTYRCQPNRGHQDFSPELCL